MAQSGSKLAWTLALFFFSGATSLVYEVLWTRRLSLTFGHTVLAVSTVLTVFMSGLALGSFLAGRWTDKERKRYQGGEGGAGRFLAVYGRLEIGIGIWAVLTLVLLNAVESVYLAAARSGAQSELLYAIVFLGSFLVLLPPTTAMGATLHLYPTFGCNQAGRGFLAFSNLRMEHAWCLSGGRFRRIPTLASAGLKALGCGGCLGQLGYRLLRHSVSEQVGTLRAGRVRRER